MRPRAVEAAVIEWLSSMLPGVQVGTRVPERMRSPGIYRSDPAPDPPGYDPAGSFIRVTRAGGERANLAQERPTILIECWSGESVEAERLACAAWDAMDGLSWAGPDWVHRVELASPVNFPDTDMPDAHRYQFLAVITANLEVRT